MLPCSCTQDILNSIKKCIKSAFVFTYTDVKAVSTHVLTFIEIKSNIIKENKLHIDFTMWHIF